MPEGHALWVWRACFRCGHILNNDFGQNGAQSPSAGTSLDDNENEQVTKDNQNSDLPRSEERLWNLKNWKVWKAAFQRIEERVYAVVLREASKALKIMEDIEAHHD